jgi:hypothetical protein
MWKIHAFYLFINVIKKKMWEAHAIKKQVLRYSHMLKNTCHFIRLVCS